MTVVLVVLEVAVVLIIETQVVLAVVVSVVPAVLKCLCCSPVGSGSSQRCLAQCILWLVGPLNGGEVTSLVTPLRLKMLVVTDG